jgi:hypothetical protein
MSGAWTINYPFVLRLLRIVTCLPIEQANFSGMRQVEALQNSRNELVNNSNLHHVVKKELQMFIGFWL